MVERQIRSAVITGCTGVLGSALCRNLISHDITIYAICHPGSKRIGNLPKDARIHVIELDITELDRLPELISTEVDAFYHFAWLHTMGAGRNDMSSQIENISMTIKAVHTALELHCKVFIGAGSQAEYGRSLDPLQPDTPCFPENGYGMAKLCAGQMSRLECSKYGIDHIWPRILSLYGPGDNKNTLIAYMIESLRDGKIPDITAGDQLWDYLYSEDAADAFRLMAEHGKNGAVYPLGSGKARPLKSYIEDLRSIVAPWGKVNYGAIPYSPQQVMHLCADITTLNKDTGWNPTTEFKAGIEKLAGINRE